VECSNNYLGVILLSTVLEEVNKLYKNNLVEKRLDCDKYILYTSKFEKIYYGDMSLLEIFSKGLANGNCYDMSLQSLFCFSIDAFLVRGYLLNNCYHHGWIEFTSDNKQIIFDTTFFGFYTKEDYYDVFNITETSRTSHKKITECKYYWHLFEKSRGQLVVTSKFA
jgi:hypothetical protein